MGQIINAIIVAIMIALVILGIILIAIPLSMSLSDNIVTKIEGILSAPLLIAAGLAVLSAAYGIAIALLGRHRKSRLG
ncbi:MAG: hypothetical protein AB1793_02070 [Candidatus Thermoplasmatota archaeon]